ncbi:helix-turn-helix domain-containing protein [Loktanella sp. S4079]|uniref:helix-turn-helix domain-containing protein n=1 Tax=Loktanella sp. S4079 TaxID=579483 RepID=UPI0005FA15DE|nr:hypothetical protein TW80_17110 [Loktanella sp. S4079]
MLYDFDDFSGHSTATEHLERLRLQRHEFIKSHLRLAGTSLAELSRELGLKSGTMTTVSKGKGQSKRVQIHIAKALNIPASTLWPEVFSKDTEGDQT